MPSGAVDYCLQKLRKVNSDREHFYNVLMVKVIGTKTPITTLDPDAHVRYDLFEKVDFFRLMRPGVVIIGEPPHVVQNVMTDLLKWFLQCPRLIVHEKVFKLLPLITGNLINPDHYILNDICKDVVIDSCHLLEILAKSTVGLDELIKAKVPNSLCVPAEVFNGYVVAKKLLVSLALKRGKDIWYEKDIANLEPFLISYVNWIKIQRDETIVKELDMLRIILGSIDSMIHKLHSVNVWGTISRELIETVLSRKPCVEDRNITMRLAMQLVQVTDVEFVVGDNFKFLEPLVVLASSYICVELENAGKEGPPGKEHLVSDCWDFLETIIVYMNNKDRNERIYGRIRCATRAVLCFLKRIGQLKENQQECNDRNQKLKVDEGAHEGNNDTNPNRIRDENCLTGKSAKPINLPGRTLTDKTEDESCDDTVELISDNLANIVLDDRKDSKSMDEEDLKTTKHHTEQKESTIRNQRKEHTSMLEEWITNMNKKVGKEGKRGDNKGEIKYPTCEYITTGAPDVLKLAELDVRVETSYIQTEKLQIEENIEENLLEVGGNDNYESQVFRDENQANGKDDKMTKNMICGSETVQDTQQVKTLNNATRDEQKSYMANASGCDVPRFALKSVPFLCKWIHASAESPDGEIIELLPFLVNVTRYILSQPHHVHQSLPKTDPLHHIILQRVFNCLWALILMSKETCTIIIREHLLEVIEKYIILEWTAYNKTTILIRNKTPKLGTKPRLTSKKKGKEVEDEKDLESEQRLFQLQELQLEQTQLIVKLMRVLLTIIEQNEDHVKTHDIYPRLCGFLLYNLPLLETNGDNVMLPFCAMTFGVLLLDCLNSIHKAPGDDLTVPFFELCVNLLSDVHQFSAHSLKQGKKGKSTIININFRFQENWKLVVNPEELWGYAMEAISRCIHIFPSLSKCILDAEWIPNILNMLKHAKSEMNEIYVTYCEMVLTACALSNDDCKNIIKRNNGLAIARKLNFRELKDILT